MTTPDIAERLSARIDACELDADTEQAMLDAIAELERLRAQVMTREQIERVIAALDPSDAGAATVEAFLRAMLAASPAPAQQAGQAPAPAPTVTAWQLERMRHIANEWADMATNGPQYLRNVRDGICTVDEALAGLAKDYEHCRKVNDAPGLYGSADIPSPAVADETAWTFKGKPEDVQPNAFPSTTRCKTCGSTWGRHRGALCPAEDGRTFQPARGF